MATQVLTPGKFIPPRGFGARVHGQSRPSGCAQAKTGRALRAAEERNRRVIELLPLVRRAAVQMRKHLPAHVEVDDLMGAGVLGLLDAVEKYDTQKRVKLESYARHRIRGAMLDGLRNLDPASRDLRKKNKKMESTLRDLQCRLGRPAEDEEIASAAGISLKEWYRTVRELQGAGVEWLRPLQAIGPQRVGEDTLVAENQDSQFTLCYRREQRDILDRALGCLSERERNIVLLYHAGEMTMKQIGSRFKIDESRVSQIHSAVVVRLRSSVQALLGKPGANPPSAGALAGRLPN